MSQSHFLSDDHKTIINIPVLLSLENKTENTDYKHFEINAYRMIDEQFHIVEPVKLLTISSIKTPTQTSKNTFEANVIITQHEYPIKTAPFEQLIEDEKSGTYDPKSPFKKIVYIPVYFPFSVASPDDATNDLESAEKGFLKINPYRLTDSSMNFKQLAELTTIALQHNTFYRVGGNILEGMQIVDPLWYKETSGYLLLKIEVDGSNIVNSKEGHKKFLALKQNTVITENDIIDFTVGTYNQKPGLPTSLPKTKYNLHHHVWH